MIVKRTGVHFLMACGSETILYFEIISEKDGNAKAIQSSARDRLLERDLYCPGPYV